MEFSFKNIFSALSIFGLMFGIISGMAFSILKILAQPFNPESWKDAGIEFAKIITNSQTEISKTVKIFPQAVKAGYGELALTRIIGASLITIFLIYIFYKGIRYWFENPKPTDKIIIILISIGLVWLLTIIASIIAGEPNFMPYSGFIDLIKNRQEIIDFIIKTYQK
jgi:hypothetical protein